LAIELSLYISGKLGLDAKLDHSFVLVLEHN